MAIIYTSSETHEAIRAEAVRRNVKISEIVALAVGDYIAKQHAPEMEFEVSVAGMDAFVIEWLNYYSLPWPIVRRIKGLAVYRVISTSAPNPPPGNDEICVTVVRIR